MDDVLTDRENWYVIQRTRDRSEKVPPVHGPVRDWPAVSESVPSSPELSLECNKMMGLNSQFYLFEGLGINSLIRLLRRWVLINHFY